MPSGRIHITGTLEEHVPFAISQHLVNGRVRFRRNLFLGHTVSVIDADLRRATGHAYNVETAAAGYDALQGNIAFSNNLLCAG